MRLESNQAQFFAARTASFTTPGRSYPPNSLFEWFCPGEVGGGAYTLTAWVLSLRRALPGGFAGGDFLFWLQWVSLPVQGIPPLPATGLASGWSSGGGLQYLFSIYLLQRPHSGWQFSVSALIYFDIFFVAYQIDPPLWESLSKFTALSEPI